MVQIVGNNLPDYIIRRFQYYEEPLNFVHVKHHFKSLIEPNYIITPCGSGTITDFGILQQDGSYIITNDGYTLIFQ
jgi:hypothetical protein